MLMRVWPTGTHPTQVYAHLTCVSTGCTNVQSGCVRVCLYARLPCQSYSFVVQHIILSFPHQLLLPLLLHVPARVHTKVRLHGKDHSVFVAKLLDKSASETVLLVPDVHTTSFSYREVAKKLHAQGMSVVAFDFPGFGLSKTPPPALYTHTDETAAAFIGKLFKSVSLRSVHLVLQGSSAAAGKFVKLCWFFSFFLIFFFPSFFGGSSTADACCLHSVRHALQPMGLCGRNGTTPSSSVGLFLQIHSWCFFCVVPYLFLLSLSLFFKMQAWPLRKPTVQKLEV